MMRSAMPHNPWHMAVLIPARNEEQLIGRCLRSVIQACRVLPRQVTWDIVVVSDSSTDQTRAVAEQLLGKVHGVTLMTEARCVGTARALAGELALARYGGPSERCWLANTDADCEIPAHWLQQQLAHAEAGWAAVAGIIDVDSFADHGPAVPERFRSSYVLHPDGTHPHVHGANLGVRADAYLAAGGWSPLPTAEDHDLWGRLQRGGQPCLAAASLSVLTSGRLTGRAPMGFARALALHNEVA